MEVMYFCITLVKLLVYTLFNQWFIFTKGVIFFITIGYVHKVIVHCLIPQFSCLKYIYWSSSLRYLKKHAANNIFFVFWNIFFLLGHPMFKGNVLIWWKLFVTVEDQDLITISLISVQTYQIFYTAFPSNSLLEYITPPHLKINLN